MNRENAMNAVFEEAILFEKPALFTPLRLDRSTVPEGLYLYELRHADEDWDDPCQIARGILVNHYGTVLTREPIQLPIEGSLELNSDDFNFGDGDCFTAKEFKAKYPASDKEVIDFFSVNDHSKHDLYFSQSEEKDKENGCIGYLMGNFGSGKQFFTRWHSNQDGKLNTREFKVDLVRILSWLRKQPDSPLKDLSAMKRCCTRYMSGCAIRVGALPSYGFMVRTKQYVYMLRCIPLEGEHNFYIYCYRREELEKARNKADKKSLSAINNKKAEPER